MDMRKLVGRNVQRIRLRKRLTQEQLAEISGFSQQYISGLEKGRRNPTIITIYELALALGVSHIDLVRPDKQADVTISK
ncbi:helix-turn-helix transcriptional regulator [Mesorhizobium sp.]|uniref:helix-turn-helix transcriptional regulator n=1 Tax=Mesorhizobium sp. TaxID=1871066 RepID=UPI000FE6E1E9|nr:helix-turn-helix transcriptional regulator [Mesorhizobium sp.]RWO19529.1 MAG: XRE family transcriptional regulator [Mesorhizobium sp.]RWO75063.1 MAG: XRE family transcriptional regulator [Mesorhizobium sp.]TIN33741.1 MAG: helix-turn-helix transcriptional regulator [Mesorhizobium sp.]TIP93649.1 MAG: helix-turn-helix transcriptional regulator [Mesorhizobium sp.]TJU84131.1 MAG: helix-turn-helix transcriptional regulator [Mesorhizobium sp.]